MLPSVEEEPRFRGGLQVKHLNVSRFQEFIPMPQITSI